jgi:hypothetical protein
MPLGARVAVSMAHLIPLCCLSLAAAMAVAAEPFRIEVVDRETGWPVPLVELRTTHHSSHVSDNCGLVAIDEPELMDQEVFFHVKSHGYGVPKDGFGYEGIRVTPRRGGRQRVEIDRRMIAKRLGRLTGAGRFAEAIKLGEKPPLAETGVFGCDSVQGVAHGGRMFWLWGDTTLPHYPLGIFHSTAATTPVGGLPAFEPPLAMDYTYFRNEHGQVRAVSRFPGDGPTWLGGLVSLPSADGPPRLGATYSKIKNHLDEYETGLCVWDEDTGSFAVRKVLWREADGAKPPIPRGHPVRWTDEDGRDWVLFGDPFPALKMPATFVSWDDPASWRVVPAPAPPRAAGGGDPVEPHRGSIAWNTHRGRWITVYTQMFGQPSAFGELWYAEADSPFGPWGPAVKVLTHDNYTFYNPRIHPELTPADAPFIVFEGTYTAEFADRPVPTPRYNYNQILYRLDLDDAGLEPARK